MKRVICVAKHLVSDTCELVKSRGKSLRFSFFFLSDFDVFQLIFFWDLIGSSRQIETVWEYLTLPKKKSFEYTYD